MNEESRWPDAVDHVTEGGTPPREDPLYHAAENAAAAAARVLVTPERPPAALRQRLRADAARFAGGGQVIRFPSAPAAATGPDSPWFPRRAWGWQLAAAAALVAALWLALGRRTAPPAPPASMAQLREALIQSRETQVAVFSPGFERYAALRGDVVWSGGTQEGFLRLRGLPANDPAQSQYQLWIVDPARDPDFPVDGGVFDVPDGDGEALVRFRPRLPVGRPVAFVITREKPGGVVKSRNEKPVGMARL